MPNPLVKTLAIKSNMSKADVEKVWDETVNDLLDSGKSKDDEEFWPIVTSVVKKKLKLPENKIIKVYRD